MKKKEIKMNTYEWKTGGHSEDEVRKKCTENKGGGKGGGCQGPPVTIRSRLVPKKKEKGREGKLITKRKGIVQTRWLERRHEKPVKHNT